jgi:hypothetical protein
MKKSAASTALLGLLLCTCCSSARHPSTPGPDASLVSQISHAKSGAAADSQIEKLDFMLVNFTGTTLQAIYVSPTDSSAWEENVIAGTELADGDSITIRFNQNEQAKLWDMKIVGQNSHYTEWKSLNLTEISKITLRLKATPELAVVAEVE